MQARIVLRTMAAAVTLITLGVVGYSALRSGIAIAISPTALRVDAIPEGNTGNAKRDVPSANLWLCAAGPCHGPGEGDLKVIERATNVLTTNSDGGPGHGLGAYDFTITFDGSVIESVNPLDLVFSTGAGRSFGGSPMSLGLGYRLGRTAVACAATPISESGIHFSCVTSGPGSDASGGHDGPSGSFALALLDLIPSPRLTTRMNAASGNGVMTVVVQRCGLIDVYGDPVTGSIDGAGGASCGDLAVTVRILEGDVNLDCRVDVIDETLIAFRQGALYPSALYNRWFDLEPATRDGDIDMKDMQQVFGREGSTCENPIPPQPPQTPPFSLNN